MNPAAVASAAVAGAVLRGLAAAPGPRFTYAVAGLLLAADLELPSARTLVGQSRDPDVTVAAAELPMHLPEPDAGGPDWEIRFAAQPRTDSGGSGGPDTGDPNSAEDTFLLRVPAVGRFLIVGGHRILYEAHPSGGESLALYLMGTCLAVLLGQRKRMVFHGSAVAVGEGAVLFCGASGAGKSTLAAELCRRGYSLLCDDVCALLGHPGFAHGRTPGPEEARGRTLRVCPDGRLLKLWQSSIEHLQLGSERGPAVEAAFAKFYLRPPAAEPNPLLLRAVYLLAAAPAGEAPTLDRLSPARAMEALSQNVYRPALVEAMRMQPFYFAGCAALQREAAVFRLRRPLEFSRMEEVVALLESGWERPG